jgi:hypothetical protein
MASASFGWLLARTSVRRGHAVLAPTMGAAGLAVGLWYALAAVHAVPYAF